MITRIKKVDLVRPNPYTVGKEQDVPLQPRDLLRGVGISICGRHEKGDSLGRGQVVTGNAEVTYVPWFGVPILYNTVL